MGVTTRYDATAFLARERSEPMTAAEHAEAFSYQKEYYRDVPASCSCLYQWFPALTAYKMAALRAGCAWHTGETAHAVVLPHPSGDR
jgi:hypothetical protein